MSGYENVIGGKLKLKGKALDVKICGGIINKKKKKKKNIKHNKYYGQAKGLGLGSVSKVGDIVPGMDQLKDGNDAEKEGRGRAALNVDHLTPAEKRYLEQWEKIDRQRLAKIASKSHRDRIQEFNQYLANLTEHYDIPKVGPG